MYKKLSQIIPHDLIFDARIEIEKNNSILKSEIVEANHKKINGNKQFIKVLRISHDDILSLHKVLDLMFCEPILDEIKNLFDEVYIINHFYCTINGYGHISHRDGQSMGFNKNGLLNSKKIFKIIIYLNNNDKLEAGGIDICPISSDPIELFKNEKLFTKVNYYIENYLKKRFLFRVNSKVGDALLMDSNVWHRASLRKSSYAQEEINKIYIAYEFVVDKEIASYYSKHMSDKYKIKTYKNNVPNKLLDLFDRKNIKLTSL